MVDLVVLREPPRALPRHATVIRGGYTNILLYAFASDDPRSARAVSLIAEELFRPVAPLTTAIHARAVLLARERGLSVYDASIVAAAQDAGWQFLFSEDLQHGRKCGTLAPIDVDQKLRTALRGLLPAVRPQGLLKTAPCGIALPSYPRCR